MGDGWIIYYSTWLEKGITDDVIMVVVFEDLQYL